jgi:hypothetical protein
VNLNACSKLRRLPVRSFWYRALKIEYLERNLRKKKEGPLGAAHTKRDPTRYCPGQLLKNPFEVLYLCEHHVLTLYEVEAIYGPLDPRGILPNPKCAWAIINVHVHLQDVADLTLPDQQDLLGTTTFQTLTGSWRSYLSRNMLAPTQVLAKRLFDLRDFEGVIVPSAKREEEKNLVVFPNWLKAGSLLSFWDPLFQKTHTIPRGKKKGP